VVAGPACRCPAVALPRLLLFLPLPTADTGPRCRTAPPVSHAAPRRPRPAALPCWLAHLHLERALPPSTVLPGAILAPRSGCRPHAAPLFLSFSLRCVARLSRSPHFPLYSPRVPADLEKTSTPDSAPRPRLSSSSPPSPPLMHPPHRLPPSEIPSSSPVLV
jgi:hypothetical protein